MKKEQFYELLGGLNENDVKAAQNLRIKSNKSKWMKYGAAAACLSVFAAAGSYICLKNLPLNDSHNILLAEAVYPEVPAYPDMQDYDDMNKYNEAYQEWLEAKKSLRNQLAGYNNGFDSFFYSTARVFLEEENTENVIYSPLSLFMALGMSAEISDGNTRKQILDVLGQSDIDTLRNNAKSIWQANYTDDGVAKCILATSLWTNNKFDYTQSTIDSLANNYYSSSYSGDPSSDAYSKAMQDWINDQTEGFLSEYVSDIQMDSEMVLSLISTVNYSGKWNYGFSENLTKSSVFHSANGDIECEFMNADRDTVYYWGEHFSSVSMGLENNGSMRLILPDSGVTPGEIINDDEVIEYMFDTSKFKNQKYATVNLSVPKFDISSNIDLNSGFKKLGITDAFDSDVSNFTPLINKTDEVFFSKVEQDNRVMIDEEGCRAASLTLIQGYTSSGEPEEYIDFILDRPFIFEIVSETGLPVFVGIVNNIIKQ